MPPAGRALPSTRKGHSTPDPFSRTILVEFSGGACACLYGVLLVLSFRALMARAMVIRGDGVLCVSFGSAPLRSPRVAPTFLFFHSSERRPPPAEGYGIVSALILAFPSGEGGRA